MQTARETLILALDVPSAQDAVDLLDRVGSQCLWVKVGLQLYLGAGQPLLETLVRRGYRIFLDLKLHDIPNTVAGAVRSLRHSGASLLTVHAAGGAQMLAAAAQATDPGAGPRLLAVTVLTSMDAAQLPAIGVSATPAAQVGRLAKLAVDAGISGLVCSTHELSSLRAELPSDSLLVVPGIRPAGAPPDDQQRSATPAQAVGMGASMIVVGRPITRAARPDEACSAILAEIASALEGSPHSAIRSSP